MKIVGGHGGGKAVQPSRGSAVTRRHPYQTLLAVLHCLHRSTGLRQAIEAAIALGGDTDTVAALVAGLLAARSTPGQVRAELPYSNRIRLLPEEQVTDLAVSLAALRTGQRDG